MSTNHNLQKHIEGCLKNDRASQKALYKHFYSFAMSICLRYANDRLDAAGILNDAFFKVFNNINKYEKTKEFTPWLGRIITNTAIDYYRSNLKFSEHTSLEGHEESFQVSDGYDKLTYNDLLAMIHKLTPAYRAVFNLYAIDGYNHEEIADMLKISVGTSKSNLFKARLKLQEMIKATEIDASRVRNISIDSFFRDSGFNMNMQ